MPNRPNITKRNARSFERWFDEDARTWPAWLYQLGHDCALVLHMVPGQEALHEEPEQNIRRNGRADRHSV